MKIKTTNKKSNDKKNIKEAENDKIIYTVRNEKRDIDNKHNDDDFRAMHFNDEIYFCRMIKLLNKLIHFMQHSELLN